MQGQVPYLSYVPQEQGGPVLPLGTEFLTEIVKADMQLVPPACSACNISARTA
jgi:hypothetical protein